MVDMTSAAESRAARAPRVALVLGSGGARGYAHIGVIAELRDRGYDIVGISGSSMVRWWADCRPPGGSMTSPSGPSR